MKSNPCEDVKIPKTIKIEKRAYTIEEYEILKNHLHNLMKDCVNAVKNTFPHDVPNQEFEVIKPMRPFGTTNL